MAFAKLKITPRAARYYLFFALVLLIAPSVLMKLFPSHAGRVLVSAGKMNSNSVFEKSVIYMSQHHAYLAVGFIINKPMPQELRDIYQKRFPALKHFHYGGPVGVNDAFFFMVMDESGLNGAVIYNGKLLQDSDPEKFNAYIKDANTRILAGYSGWGAMQLNREIYRGWWDAIDFNSEYLNDQFGNNVWNKAVDRVLAEKNANIDAI